MTSTFPELHQRFLDRALAVFAQEPGLAAVLGGGSLVHGGFDAWSDLDLVLVYDAPPVTLDDKRALAMRLGDLVSSFTGEHVGEPRLLIALYEPELLHVDLKFVDATELDQRVERPAILWARDRAALEARLDQAQIAWPQTDAQWLEDRAWIWLHYGASKLGRGELYEAIGMLGFFREQVLGPMLARRLGWPERGVRKIDEAPGADALKATLASADRDAVRDALRAAIAAYLDLRSDAPPAKPAPGMPDALLAYLDRT
ncbi:nucleotidyltransferase domain-containing protein [Oceanicaulis sp. LC35]|uniref:nucleotidyltransferase domain-containing protein n=1 Tax=Oceanicaulis sp. LC35 TaxID=3349635 RepID=UPI003F867404